MELLDVPGNGGLGAAEPPGLEPGQQLLLSLDVLLGNDLQDHGLPVKFHVSIPPGSIF